MLNNFISDDQLMEKIAKGDKESFGILFNRHGGKVLGYALRLLGGDQFMAEDISQNVWIKVVQRASSYQQTGSFIAWIYTITRNSVIDEMRRKKVDSLQYNSDETSETPSTIENSLELSQKSFEAYLLENSDLVIIKKSVDELPEAQRIALTIWLVEDKSYEEIAEHFQQSVSSVKSLLFRAKQNLKELIKGQI